MLTNECPFFLLLVKTIYCDSLIVVDEIIYLSELCFFDDGFLMRSREESQCTKVHI